MARHFKVPPGWPPLPTPNWIPPREWSPDPTWPAPPPGWTFYVDGPAARGRVGWVEPLLTVVAALWVVGWLVLSGLGVFFQDSCPSGPTVEASSQCGSRLNTALLRMGIAQVSVLLLAFLCFLVRRLRLVGVIVAVVAVPFVFIVFFIAAAAIVEAG
jgi:hypothetical protein